MGAAAVVATVGGGTGRVPRGGRGRPAADRRPPPPRRQQGLRETTPAAGVGVRAATAGTVLPDVR